MKKKVAIQYAFRRSLLILCAIFWGITLFIISCSNEPSADAAQEGSEPLPSTCIERIIALDDSLGGLRNHGCEQISLNQTIMDYADGLEALDFRGCPERFGSAFKSHIQAWRDMLPVIAEYSDLRGEMHDLFDELAVSTDSTVFKLRLDEIWSTWAEIELAMKEAE